MSRFLGDAESILEAAVAARAEGAEDVAIVVSPGGGIQIRQAAGWSTESLAAESGARTIYRVSRTERGVRVEGRNGLERCCLEKETPTVVARRLLASKR